MRPQRVTKDAPSKLARIRCFQDGSDEFPHYARGVAALQNSLYLSLGEWPRLPFAARIERAHSYRARSASKKGTWPLPPHPSEAARCASKGIVPATPSPIFSILLVF